MRSVSSRPRWLQLSPPSLLLYTPSPTDTLLRTHDSPVPTQTVSGLDGSIATAPIDCVCLSNVAFQLMPPSSDLHTPPDALPTHSVSFSPCRPSIAATRPLVVAG